MRVRKVVRGQRPNKWHCCGVSRPGLWPGRVFLYNAPVETDKTLVIEGHQFELLGVQRSGAAVYRGSGVYARVGDKSVILSDLMQHREMESAKYPVAEIVSEGEIGGKMYFLETALGDRSFRVAFQEEYEAGRVSDATFTRFTKVVKKLFTAQLAAREPSWNVADFAAGIGVTKLSTELPAFRTEIEKRFVEATENLSKLPGAIQHGDCNASNIYEGGIIDIEDSFRGPIGYDIISALVSIEWSPATRNYEFFAQYRFTAEQKAQYLKTFAALCKDARIPDVTRFIDDLAYCRALWLCTGMREWPRIQQWRFEKFLTEYLHRDSNFR
jgi:hypothetical protein